MGCPINLVLASSSPRRRQLLTEMGWSSFKTRPAELDETPLMGEKPEEMVLRLAENKALAVGMHYALDTSVWILGADTTVNVGGIILEKPLDRRDAFRMIKLLAGKTHLVHTGIALVSSGVVRCSAVETTAVTFQSMQDEEIHAFVNTGEGDDKAGAYAIQGKGTFLVERIDGCYFNVVGLPLHRLSLMFAECGWPLASQWECFGS